MWKLGGLPIVVAVETLEVLAQRHRRHPRRLDLGLPHLEPRLVGPLLLLGLQQFVLLFLKIKNMFFHLFVEIGKTVEAQIWDGFSLTREM